MSKGADNRGAGNKLTNDKYDEAVDVSQSIDRSHIATGKDSKFAGIGNNVKGIDSLESNGPSTASNRQPKDAEKAVNKPFDEALDFSRSGSDESIDTRLSDKKGSKALGKPSNRGIDAKPNATNMTPLITSSSAIGPSPLISKSGPSTASSVGGAGGQLSQPTKQPVSKNISDS